MKIYYNIEDYKVENTFLTIGSFDGLHLGHQQLIQRLIHKAKLENAQSTVLTFWPHPRMVLSAKQEDLKLLNTISERIELFGKTGIDNLIVFPFTKEFSMFSASDFIEQILVKQLKIKGLIIGYDHQFGHNRLGEVNCIAKASERHKFYLEQIEAFSEKNINISSTKIRNALIDGDIELAKQFLNYNYTVSGKVIHGNKIGRNLGFPTANIAVNEHYKLIPGKGVYAVEIHLTHAIHYGMMNIGTRPTLNSSSQSLSIEVNIFDFSEIIYEQEVKIVLLKKIRNEQKFDGLDALKQQLAIDKLNAIRIINC